MARFKKLPRLRGKSFVSRNEHFWSTVLENDVGVANNVLRFTPIVSPTDWVVRAGMATATLVRIRGHVDVRCDTLATPAGGFNLYYSVIVVDADDAVNFNPMTSQSYIDHDVLWTRCFSIVNASDSSGSFSQEHDNFALDIKVRRKLKPDDFLREGLGIWDEDDGPKIMPKWDDRGNVKVERPSSLVVGLAGDVDGEWGSIGSAGMDDDGRLIVGAVKRQPGQGWLVAEAKRIQDEHGYLVAIDEKGPLSDLLVDLDTAGVRYVGLSLTQYVDACQSLWRQVEDDQLRHPKHPELDAAVRRAKWRKVGDRKAFGRQSGDISMLEAVTVAASQVFAEYDVLDSIF